jgi:signal transduction histidine kinase
LRDILDNSEVLAAKETLFA